MEGTVTDPNGEPVPHVQIDMWFLGTCFVGRRHPLHPDESTTTNARGEYVFHRQRLADEDTDCTTRARLIATPPDSTALRADTIQTEDADVAVGTSPTLTTDVQLDHEK